MKVVLPGGSGQVGMVLARAFVARGDEVVVLTRSGGRQSGGGARCVVWDGRTLGGWAAELEGADVVINLAGRSVNCRYTPENRRAIIDSRVESTGVLGQAIRAAARPPRVWLQASTATIYAHRFDAPNDEATGIMGGMEPGVPETWRFSIEVATQWERAAAEFDPLPATRRVLLRSAIIMSPDEGGAFAMLLRLVRLGLGGQNGDGRQFVSWIHEADFVRAVLWLIEHEEMDGPVNLAAPSPLPNVEFMRALRHAWGMPIGLPAFEWMLAIGAFFLRTETELILKSRRVISTRLAEHGFEFQYADWPAAARELCARWRSRKTASGRKRPTPPPR